ncbi:helix-turn-helix domain-containing protein [Asaia bogorensis]|uniref:HTH cro/C1-type domain-containing protein n=1 Tax=Asaia bogorensis NBRC 16594 TaxID=1231624 RepID=A0AAN4R4S2_9PROT|nr:helix-turn-helix transcriptional regulator [Asaia bogorensis]BAT19795.1 transcriptional regulator XRE [Asaia bogorensis NBRC 16594]GBQ77680.1 hypothetical protein AA0311_1514 [Asaia bogorensis NBRC 16594]GEL54365.1 hypothetical protein ABO01nite_23720 [Asaia bogorensis NBRC 16594]
MSFKKIIPRRRKIYLELLSDIDLQLKKAYSEENTKSGLSKADLARKLEKDKSFVTRIFNGTRNITVETIADMAYALNRKINFELTEENHRAGKNEQIKPSVIMMGVGK